MVEQKVPARYGDWDVSRSSGREVRRGWLVWSTGDVGRLQLVFCFSLRDCIWENREGGESLWAST